MKPSHIVLVSAAALGWLPAQMEKRDRELYRQKAFEQRSPRIGTQVPDLRLRDLDGHARSLAAERGKTLVLVGGSFT